MICLSTTARVWVWAEPSFLFQSLFSLHSRELAYPSLEKLEPIFCGNSASCYDLSGMVSSLTQVTPKLKGWRTVTDPTIWRSPSRFGQNNHPNSQSTPFQVINSWKVGDKQTSTFNGENPYTPSEANWESLSTFNWECCINPLLLGWWVYPLFNMEILGVDRPFVAHIC